MNAITAFAKAHTALIGAAAAWLIAALKDGHVTGQEWYGLVVAVATGLGVAAIPNRAKHRKAHRNAQAGYSLIEMVFAVFVLIILVLLVIFLAQKIH